MPLWMTMRVVPSREYMEWMAKEFIEPWGDARSDWQTALICSTLANMFRDPKKQPQPFEPKDFLLRFVSTDGELTTVLVADAHVDPEAVERAQGQQQAELMLAKVKRLNAIFGGREATPEERERMLKE